MNAPEHAPEPDAPLPGDTGEPPPGEPVGKPSDEETEETLEKAERDVSRRSLPQWPDG